MPIDETEFDPYSGLFTVYDAVHGAIDLRDPQGLAGAGGIVQLLNSQMVERLRRIKQLGYASHSYTAADHSRYAHAIGTMHMMKIILNHLFANKGINEHIYEDLRKCFPRSFPQSQFEEGKNSLVRHMLLAALLQDVGELPHSKATSMFFKPNQNLKDSVKKVYGGGHWSDKSIFTVAYIEHERSSNLLHALKVDKDLLVFLITGHKKEPEGCELDGLRVLRHILDGAVDADRLDYVFRDAYHTVGGFGMPKTVVESLLGYDKDGPVFSDMGVVADFLTLRAHLWTTVYYSPQNRFRMILLTTLLSGIKNSPQCAAAFFGGVAQNGLSVDEFEKVDDISLMAHLTEFYEMRIKKNLTQRAQNALKLLLGRGPEYVCYWLPRPQNPDSPESQMDLPDELFFDTYSDLQGRSLYQAGSIRVRNEKFKHLGRTLSLEDCCGAFSGIFKGPNWSALPMPGSYLLFVPRDTSGGAWTQIDTAIEKGKLYRELMRNDPLLIDFTHDTTQAEGFTRPAIFISFRWRDLAIAKEIARALFKRNRQYYLLIDHYEGDPTGTRQSSSEAVNRADSVLIVASESYLEQLQVHPDGNIAAEISAMIIRRANDGLVPTFLSVDGHEVLTDRLPFADLGTENPPNTGKALKGATPAEIEEAVDFALRGIDGNWASRKRRTKK